MPSFRSSAVLLLFAWLAFAAPIQQGSAGSVPKKGRDAKKGDEDERPRKFNTLKNSLDGVVLFTGSILQETRAGEPVLLSLQLKNLGKQTLTFGDVPFDTFFLNVKTKEGSIIAATRYFGSRFKHDELNLGGGRARHVEIELAPGEEAQVALPLDRLFDLTLEGEYAVSAEASFTVNTVSGKIAIENLPFKTDHASFVRIAKVRASRNP